jgi:uncharacterized integral membrane protein
MIRKAVTALVLVPLAIACVAFAVANRQIISITFDPFDPANPALTLAVPLFVLVLVLVIAGVVLGGVAAWLRQSKWRRAARLAEAESRRLRAELEQSRRRNDIAQVGAASRRVAHAPRLTIPPPAA